MNQKEVEIYCKFCFQYQVWRGQKQCVGKNCGAKLQPWHIASQLKAKGASPNGVRPSPAP